MVLHALCTFTMYFKGIKCICGPRTTISSVKQNNWIIVFSIFLVFVCKEVWYHKRYIIKIAIITLCNQVNRHYATFQIGCILLSIIYKLMQISLKSNIFGDPEMVWSKVKHLNHWTTIPWTNGKTSYHIFYHMSGILEGLQSTKDMVHHCSSPIYYIYNDKCSFSGPLREHYIYLISLEHYTTLHGMPFMLTNMSPSKPFIGWKILGSKRFLHGF